LVYGSYIAVDPSNDAIYEADSLGGMQAYTAFAVAQSDGQIIQQNTGEYNPNNLACPLTIDFIWICDAGDHQWVLLSD
jgi:hypothetical protein